MIYFLGINWLDLLAVQGTLKSLLQHHSSKASILWPSAFFIVQLTSIHDHWKNHSFDYMAVGNQSSSGKGLWGVLWGWNPLTCSDTSFSQCPSLSCAHSITEICLLCPDMNPFHNPRGRDTGRGRGHGIYLCPSFYAMLESAHK